MLILCEKPSVAKDFAKTLGCQARKGYYQNDAITITNCIGHLFELCPPQAYDPAYGKWRLEDLPIIPDNFRYEKIASTKEQCALVLSLLKQHERDDILIATDAGREGELIAREALMAVGIRDLSRCRRFWVSEALTEPVIRAGIKNARPLAEYDKISAQGFARQKADWLVGMNLSRYMSIGNPSAFSVGRVQTAVLHEIADRNAEAAHFVPKPYQELEAVVQSNTGASVRALLVNPQTKKTVFAENDAYLPQAKLYCTGKPVDKTEAQSARKIQKPERLLNITTLQKAAYKQFGYSPEKTLDIAQSLYEKHKCLSYPRTPSRVMGDNNVELFREKFELLKNDFVELSKLSDALLIRQSNKHIFNSAALEDHHALIPLNRLPSGVSEDEKNIYGIVVKTFFMVCMPDYIYNEKQLRFFCGQYIFTATIRETAQAGWKAAVGKDEKSDEQEVGRFDERHCLIVKAEILNKKTQPPKEYSIDTLLSFMENPRGEDGEKLAGLGTPATRAEIIKKLFMREYVFDKGKKLCASDKGLFLLKQLQKDAALAKIADVSQTTEWEKQLADDPLVFEKTIAVFIRACIKRDEKREVYHDEKAAIGKCPLCGGEIIEGKKDYYCGNYKAGCAFVLWKELCGARVTAADAQSLLAGKRTGVKKCVSKAGKSFSAKFYLDESKRVAFEFAEKK